MSNRQIQPVRNRDIQIIRQARPRSIWGQVWNVALQPNNFFLALPQAPSSSRQWFWVAVLILALNGFSAVRQESLASGLGGGGGDSISQSPGDFSSQPSGGFSSAPGGAIAIQPGGFPGGGGDLGSIPTDTGTTSDISSTWVTALISATTILVGWFVLAVILCEVPLFNGVRPTFSQNLQIAIWTTVPLGVMAGLQVIYFAAGGKVGAGGISGLLDYWKTYNDLSPFIRSVLLSLTSRLTIFWVWTLVLIYIGGRNALNGKAWAVILVVVVWALILIFVPVITGAVTAPTIVNNDLPETITLPENNGEISPEATLSESDLFSTIVPNGGLSPESTPVAGFEALPTDENITDIPQQESDFSLSTEQPTDDSKLNAVEPQLATATPS